jgi:hypothetical protein
LNGLYACVGFGVTTPTFLAFSASGILNFTNGGETVNAPAGTLWTFDFAGFGVQNISVEGGTFQTSSFGEGNLFLTFGGNSVPELPPDLTFQYNVVMADTDAKGVAHTFYMTFDGADVNFVQTTTCTAESKAAGNPTPVTPKFPY